jgi:hypothetical protein
MAKTTLLGSIELTKLKHVFIQNKKGKDGTSIIPCLCIPIPHNQIYEFPVKDEAGNVVPEKNSNRFGFEIRLLVNDEKDQYGRNGFLAKKLTKEEYEAHKDDEKYLKENQPILGNVVKLTANPDAPAEAMPVVDEESNLPF